MKVAAIIPAAGKGRRLKIKTLKPFVSVAGRPLLAHTLIKLAKSFPFVEIILPVDPFQSKNVSRLLSRYGLRRVRVVAGGRTRAESVRNGLREVSSACDWVLVHDAARPLVSRPLVMRLLKAARKTGAAICGLPATSTIKRVNRSGKNIVRTEDRKSLFVAQTPQVFRKDLLIKQYETLGQRALRRTDEAALFDGTAVRVSAVAGDSRNIKITTLEDIELMKFYLRRKN